MANQSMLFFEERQELGEGHGEGVGNVQAGGGILILAGFERILRREQGVTRCAGGEDFAHVVGVSAESVTRTDGQLLEQVGGAEFRLQRVVGGEPTVGAGANNTQTAGNAADVSAGTGADLTRRTATGS